MAAVYDSEWYTGCISEKSLEFEDVKVNFMKRLAGTNSFSFPSRKDECWIPWDQVLCLLPVPTSTSNRGHMYIFDDEVLEYAQQQFNSFIAANRL